MWEITESRKMTLCLGCAGTFTSIARHYNYSPECERIADAVFSTAPATNDPELPPDCPPADGTIYLRARAGLGIMKLLVRHKVHWTAMHEFVNTLKGCVAIVAEGVAVEQLR